MPNLGEARAECQQALDWLHEARTLVIQKIIAGGRPDEQVMLTMPPAYQKVWQEIDEVIEERKNSTDWRDVLED